MCITDRHDMTLAVKVALNSNTTNQRWSVLRRDTSEPKPRTQSPSLVLLKLWKDKNTELSP